MSRSGSTLMSYYDKSFIYEVCDRLADCSGYELDISPLTFLIRSHG